MTTTQRDSVYVFFAYARRDRSLRDKLEDHLSNLKYRGLITTWHDTEIRAGEEWLRQVEIYLNSARIILLLISSDFMASEYCYSIEMKRAMGRHERGEARVIPIMLRPVLFRDEPFTRLMADFGEAGTAEVDGRGRRDDTLLSRRTRPTVLTEKRGRDGKQSVAPSSPRDAD